MAKTPSMSTADCESVLGTRGHLIVDHTNRGMVRKWLTAQGFPSLFVGGLSMRELGLAYNDSGEEGLDKLRKKLAEARENDDTEEAVETAVETVKPNGNGHDKSLATIRDILLQGYEPKAAMDEERVRAIVDERMSSVAPRVIEVRLNDQAVKVEGRVHPIFERVLKLVTQGLKVLLVGPAGCGKTTLASHLAKALGVEYGLLSGSAGVSEGEIKGWLLPSDGGKFEYAPSDFVTKYERGNYLHLWDEIDGFDNNMLLSINCAVENGHFSVVIRRDNPIVRKGENVFMIASANTFGTGANPIYCGRNPMDEATRDRFVIVEMDYDTDLERDIARAGGLADDEAQWIWDLRDRVRTQGLRRCISTRAFQKAAGMKAAGDSWITITETLIAGWTLDERSKVGL